jgi:hypothetical protein
MERQQEVPMNERKTEDQVQGEGDYEATRRYRKRTEEFLENNDVEKAAIRAAPEDAQEAEELESAEQAGKSRAKGEDPAIERDTSRH